MSEPLDRMDEMPQRVETISNTSSDVADRLASQKEFRQEMALASAVTLSKTLDFLRFLTYEERELEQDLADACAAIAEGQQEGPISLADLKQELGLSGMSKVEILPAARRQIKTRQTGVKSRNVLDRVMNTRQELLSTIEQLSEEQLSLERFVERLGVLDEVLLDEVVLALGIVVRYPLRSQP
jgi:hypothetical protein